MLEALVDFVNREVDLLLGVGGHEGDADEGVLRLDGGSDDGSDEDARFEEEVGEEEGLVVVADEERYDGRFGVADLESEVAESLHSVVGVVPESLLALGFGAHDVERGEDGSGVGGSHGSGEDIGAHVVLHPVDCLGVGSDEAADGGERLGEGAHDDIDVGELTEVVADAATLASEDAEAVSLIDHQGGVVFVAELDHLIDLSDIALHREDAVGDDEFAVVGVVLLEETLEVFEVEMLVFVVGGEGYLLALHDGSVVTLVEIDEVVASGDAGDGARVGEEARGEEHDGILAQELAELVLELDMDVESAVEEGRAGAASTVFVDGGFGGFLDFGMVSKAQIGVGAEHKDFLTMNENLGVLFGRYGGEIRVDTFSFGLLRGCVLC